MAKYNKIQGVEYNKVQTEYQYFPEEYFSGADVTIYFDDVWVDEIVAMQFRLSEAVMPLRGYNSYTWDSIARGGRIVQGQFTIAFRESGYLHRIFDHIGQLKFEARPALAYMQQQLEVPPWVAGVKETLDQLLNRTNPEYQKEIAGLQSVPSPSSEAADGWETMQFGDSVAKAPHLKEYQKMIKTNTDEDYRSGVQKIPGLIGPIDYHVQSGLKRGDTGEEVEKLQIRLNGYFDWDLNYVKLNTDGIFEAKTEAALKRWQREFSKSIPDNELGWVGPATYDYIIDGIAESGWFDAMTRLATLRFQKEHKLQLTGNLDTETLLALRKRLVIKVQPATPAEKEYAKYEDQIWGDDFDNDNRDRNTYFYSSEDQSWLKTDGFDIYINYGPLAESIDDTAMQLGRPTDLVNFNTTVRAIRNIQIQDFEVVLSPTGQPIAETYYFVARDID